MVVGVGVVVPCVRCQGGVGCIRARSVAAGCPRVGATGIRVRRSWCAAAARIPLIQMLLSRDVLLGASGDKGLQADGAGDRRGLAGIGAAVAQMSGARDKLSALLGSGFDAAVAEAAYRELGDRGS